MMASEGTGNAGGRDTLDLYLVRHAQSFNNAVKIAAVQKYGDSENPEAKAYWLEHRSADPDLSDLGRQQAQHLGDRLAAELVGRSTTFVCTPMRRTYQTIEPTLVALGVSDPDRVLCHAKFYEHGGAHNQGVAVPGATKAEMEGRHPLRCVDFPEAAGWHEHQDGHETWEEFNTRIRHAKRWLMETFIPETAEHSECAVVVSHGTFMSYILRALQNQQPGHRFGYIHGNTGITHLKWHRTHGIFLMSANDTAHVPVALSTGGSMKEGWWTSLQGVGTEGAGNGESKE